ncbi:TIP41-like family-domain-containing protein [Chytridium lagenaria]|nr:TIP41-like family-domain-containing protein [Chytridium lagenaria]
MSVPKLFESPGRKGIQHQGWTITSQKATILNAQDLTKAAELVPNLTFPEMLFGNNHLRIEHESGISLTFSALDALEMVDASPDAGSVLQVSYAKQWAAKSLEGQNQKLKDVVKPYDWTYSTLYKGTLEGSKTFEPTTEQIDVERLKRPDPILFYEENVLYEDELADNGSCILNVRVRVMPSCFLVLLRYFLRIDDVLFRIHDTRVYHEFGTTSFLREFSKREVEFDAVRSKIPKTPWGPKSLEDLSLLTDMNWVANVISTLPGEPAVTREKMEL